jgi:hypothetical protein
MTLPGAGAHIAKRRESYWEAILALAMAWGIVYGVVKIGLWAWYGYTLIPH